MKIVELFCDNFIFEVRSSMRTISILPLQGQVQSSPHTLGKANRYYLQLPEMRFVGRFQRGKFLFGEVALRSLSGVFLRDGNVYPMMLPNISRFGQICLGGMKRHYSGDNLEFITDEIYSNFIQSSFTYHCDFKNMKSQRDVDEFYIDWSSRGRNYDICSDVRIKMQRDWVRANETNETWWLDASFYKKYLSMSG